MATIDRSTIIRGPAQVTFGGQVFFSKGNISVTVETSQFEQTSDVFGIIKRVKTDTQVRVRFTPVGEIDQTAVLYPYFSSALGTSLFGSTDSVLEIKGLKNKLTVYNCAVTQMPSLTLGAGVTAFGEVEITGLVKNSAEPDLQASYYAYAESTNTYSTDFDPTKVKSGEYQATYLGYTHTAVEPFNVEFNLELAPVTIDAIGTVDMRLQEVGWTATWSPVHGSIPTYILQYLTQSVNMGGSLYQTNISIAGPTGQVSFTADLATLVSSDMAWGTDVNLSGPLTVQGTRDINSGALDPICAIGIAS